MAIWTRTPNLEQMMEASRKTAVGHMGIEYLEVGDNYVKGRMPVATHSERNVLIAPARAHSRKPDEQYAKIERLYPQGRRLELFARQRWPGWDAWGNEVDCSPELCELLNGRK